MHTLQYILLLLMVVVVIAREIYFASTNKAAQQLQLIGRYPHHWNLRETSHDGKLSPMVALNVVDKVAIKITLIFHWFGFGFKTFIFKCLSTLLVSVSTVTIIPGIWYRLDITVHCKLSTLAQSVMKFLSVLFESCNSKTFQAFSDKNYVAMTSPFQWYINNTKPCLNMLIGKRSRQHSMIQKSIILLDILILAKMTWLHVTSGSCVFQHRIACIIPINL